MVTPTTQPSPAGRQPTVSSRYSPPRMLEALIERPALLTALLDDASGKITVLAGPHGFSKTALLQTLYHYHQQRQQRVHWLSLTPEDNDPQRLRKHLSEAFELPMGDGTESLEDIPEHCLAFIDGLEQLHNPIAHALAEWFMLSLPASSTLYTSATRVRGTLLHNARLRGLVNVVGPRQLRMNSAEAQQILGDSYSAYEADYLNNFVDGWPAGLRLLQRNPDCCRRLLSSRSENTIPVEMQEYFDDQFAAKLPAQTLQALMQLSVFERFTPALLAAMPEPPCTWQLVDEQIENGLFLAYADERREWVAFHPVFSKYLSERLRREDPARYEALKLFAAQRLLAGGHHAEAVHHATGLSCTPVAARIIEEAGGITVQVGPGRNITLEQQITPQQAGELPLLFISQLYQRIRCGRFHEARTGLEQAWSYTHGFSEIAAGSDPQVVQAWALLIRVVLHVSFDEPCQLEYTQRLDQYMHQLLASEPLLAASIASVLAFYHVELCDYVRVAQVCRLGMQAMQQPQENRITVFILLHRISAELATQSLDQARLSSEEALRQAFSDRVNDSYEVLAAQMVRALVHYEQNELNEAWELLAPALQQVHSINGWMRLYALSFSAAAEIAGRRDGLDAALEVIRQGERFACERQYPRLSQFMAIARLREYARAQQWAQAIQMIEGETLQHVLNGTENDAYHWLPRLQAMLACAELHLDMGRPHDCLSMLDKLKLNYPLTLDNRAQVSIELLSMRARFALRRFNAAFEHFHRAAALLRQGNYSYRIQQARPYLLELLNWSRRQNRLLSGNLEEWLRSVLQTTADDKPCAERNARVAANFRLSPRETEIISLVAAGYINKEIAALLGISEGTVKSHRKSVHEKLGVNSRSQAISRARELLLI